MTAALVIGLILAQSTGREPQASTDLERVRRALAAPAPSLLASESVRREGVVFRVKVRGLALVPAWEDRSIVPPWIRPSAPPTHFEFLEQVTPEEFRAGTLYPGALGIPVVPLVEYLSRHYKAARRKMDQERTRSAVSKALADFLACRSDSSKPGCTQH